jgi:hypothetical protein
MTSIPGGAVQWTNARVFEEDGEFMLTVPAFIDERAPELVATALEVRLRRKLGHAVSVEVDAGTPGAILIKLKEPLPDPGVISKAVRDAIDEAYSQASEVGARAREYEQQVRGLENSFPPSGQ